MESFKISDEEMKKMSVIIITRCDERMESGDYLQSIFANFDEKTEFIYP